MKKIKLIMLFFIITTKILSQDYLGYSNEYLNLKSEVLRDSIKLHLHLPETFYTASESTKYPITIIFDSQHQRTYPHIINSIDLLTNESQMPETIVIGVPFTSQNRFYRTSNQKTKNDTLSGIQKTEHFLFQQLIPKLQKEYNANDFITLIGHSRTAFLVNYLTTTQSKKIDISIALSGFYDNAPISKDYFKSYISNSSNFPSIFKYYYTAGSSLEEKTYLVQCKEMAEYMAKSKLPKNFKGSFSISKNANHMTNLWMSVPLILTESYGDYNAILNTWFDYKLKNDKLKNPVQEFKTDLHQVSEKLGFTVNPSLTQLFSIASDYKYSKKDLKTAIDFFKLAMEYYPNFTDFDLELVALYQELKDDKMLEFYKKEYTRKINSRKDLNEAEKAKLLKYLEE